MLLTRLDANNETKKNYYKKMNNIGKADNDDNRD